VTSRNTRALGKALSVIGWLCVVLVPLVILDMVDSLAYMPEAWWRPAEGTPLSLGQFDLRMMVICPGFRGWLGGWGYLISLVWMPIAAWRAWRARRAGIGFVPQERILLLLIPTLFLAVQCLLRLTPLGYAYPLF